MGDPAKPNISQFICPDHPKAGQRVIDGYGRVACPVCHRVLAWVEPPDPILARMVEKVKCVHCGQREPVRLRKTIAIDGKHFYVWYCINCERYAIRGACWLSHGEVERFVSYLAARYPDKDYPKKIADIQTVQDYSGQASCFICGAKGAQRHHLMPQAFAEHPDVKDEWLEWDMLSIELCPKHHGIWHKLVAPLSALAQVR